MRGARRRAAPGVGEEGTAPSLFRAPVSIHLCGVDTKAPGANRRRGTRGVGGLGGVGRCGPDPRNFGGAGGGGGPVVPRAREAVGDTTGPFPGRTSCIDCSASERPGVKEEGSGLP